MAGRGRGWGPGPGKRGAQRAQQAPGTSQGSSEDGKHRRCRHEAVLTGADPHHHGDPSASWRAGEPGESLSPSPKARKPGAPVSEGRRSQMSRLKE